MANNPEPCADGVGAGLDETPGRFIPAAENCVIALEQRRPPAELAALVREREARPQRVLIVVADEDDALAWRELLARPDQLAFRADWAASAEAALRRLAASHYDICIVDQLLPDRDGLELIRIIQRRGFRTPVILTGNDLETVDCDQVVDLGIMDLIDKEELDAGRLVRSIRLAIARQSVVDRADRLAQHDELTGLPKRSLFDERLRWGLASARRHRSHLAVMILDVSSTEAVVSRFGCAARDELLRAVGERLSARLRETDTVARLRGNEFAILIENLALPENSVLVAGKILDAVTSNLSLAVGEAPVEVSIGVALYPGDAQDAAALLRLADTALEHAKLQVGSCCRFHSAELDRAGTSRGAALHAGLRGALDRQQLSLLFQPQMTLAGSLVGVTSVLRWADSVSESNDADRMRAVAEQAGQVEAITEWMLQAACTAAHDWQQRGLRQFYVSIPVLSRRQLGWSTLATRADAELQRLGLPRRMLELEIDERLLVDELEAGGAGLQPFAELGLSIAVAGFGASGASLRLLRDAPLTTLKLAKQITEPASNDLHHDRFLVSVVRFAKQLGLRVVAEGVQGHDRIRLLRLEGCDAVQSSFCCPPLAADACVEWLMQARAPAP